MPRNTSPTLAAQSGDDHGRVPGGEVRRAGSRSSRDNTRQGAVLAFGEPVEAHYRLDQADVVLSLDADFLTSGPASLRLQREFAARRRPSAGSPQMNRLYAVESTPTPTGATADHRLALRAVAGRGLRARGGRGRGRRRSRRRGRPPVGRAARGRPQARRGEGARPRRRVAAAGGSRARPRDQRGARRRRHDGRLHRSRRDVAAAPRTRACATSSARCGRARSSCS